MTFTPSRLSISAISKANPCVVTTSIDHNLTTGQIVRTIVPKRYGMVELNNLLLSITVIGDTTFSLQYTQSPIFRNVDSRDFTAFTIPSNPAIIAQIIPVGSGASPLTEPEVYLRNNVSQNSIDDATANISTVEQPF